MAASAAQSFAFGAEIGENAGQAVTVQAEPQLQNGTAVIPEEVTKLLSMKFSAKLSLPIMTRLAPRSGSTTAPAKTAC